MFGNIIKEINEKNLNVHAIEVFSKGEVIFRHCFSPDIRYPIYSAAKSFTSAAFSIACDEGKISPDTPIGEFMEKKYLVMFPSAFGKLPVSRFLSMSVAGYPFRPEGNDWLEFTASLPIDYNAPPAFSYSNIPAYLVGVVCENAVGMHLIDYLKPRLFEPLGIEDPVYRNCPKGHFYGATGMELTVHELSLLGILYMQNGYFNNTRIISEKCAADSVSPKIYGSEGGYGYFFWITGNSFRISGKWGQKCLVYPEKKLVITYLSDLPEGGNEMLEIAAKFAEFM